MGTTAIAAGEQEWSFTGGLRTTNPELMAKLNDYVKGPGRGVVLKATTYMQQTDDKKGTTYDTLATTVSDIKKGPIDAGLFTYPGDYAVTDMTAGMEGVQVAADSANKAGKNTGLTDSLENASKKDDKGSAVKKGLKGLFKKP